MLDIADDLGLGYGLGLLTASKVDIADDLVLGLGLVDGKHAGYCFLGIGLGGWLVS